MKKYYEVLVTELRYGAEYVLAESDEEAKQKVQDEYDRQIDSIRFHGGKLTDIEAQEAMLA